MTEDQRTAAPPKRPDWVKVGAWVRPTNAHYMGVAFITFLTDTGFKYHFAKPWKTHVRDEGWQVGGESFTTDWWEPCSSPLSETEEQRKQRAADYANGYATAIETAAQVAENWGNAPPNPQGRRAALAAEIRAIAPTNATTPNRSAGPSAEILIFARHLADHIKLGSATGGELAFARELLRIAERNCG